MARCHSKRLLFANSWWGRLLSVGSMRVRGDFVWSEILERERERGNGVWGKSSFERRGFVIFQYPQTRSCGLWLSLESEVWKTSFTLSHSGFLGLWIGLTQVKLLVPIHLWNSKVTLSHKARAKLIFSMLWLLQILLHLVMTFEENYSSILLII